MIPRSTFLLSCDRTETALTPPRLLFLAKYYRASSNIFSPNDQGKSAFDFLAQSWYGR
jgi:hypothetical protein